MDPSWCLKHAKLKKILKTEVLNGLASFWAVLGLINIIG